MSGASAAASVAGRSLSRRVVDLSLLDCAPIPLNFLYTFKTCEKESLDLARLRAALDTLLDGDYWLLRGRLRNRRIVVPSRRTGEGEGEEEEEEGEEEEEEDEEDADAPALMASEKLWGGDDDNAEKKQDASGETGVPDVMWQVSDRSHDLDVATVQEDAQLAHQLGRAPVLGGNGDRILYVRVTQLKDGFLLGISLSHAYADAHTFYRLFWPSWAAVYAGRPPVPSTTERQAYFSHEAVTEAERGLPPDAPTSTVGMAVLELDGVPPLPPLDPAPQPTPGGSPSTRVRLCLSGEQVQTLRRAVGARSRFQAVAVLVWKGLGKKRLGFPTDVREKVERWTPKVPFSYAGNGITLHGVSYEGKDGMDAADPTELAKLLADAIDGATYETNVDLLARISRFVKKPGVRNPFMHVPVNDDTTILTSWLNSELSPSFGDGAPRPQPLWASAWDLARLIILTDGETAGGIDIHGLRSEIDTMRVCFETLTK